MGKRLSRRLTERQKKGALALLLAVVLAGVCVGTGIHWAVGRRIGFDQVWEAALSELFF